MAMAISSHGNNSKLIVALWGAFDRGSWVSPQLAVYLECLDPEFSLQAKTRAEQGCPVVPGPMRNSETPATEANEEVPTRWAGQRLRKVAECFARPTRWENQLGEEMARQHVERRPDGPLQRSAKALAALIYLCSSRADCAEWVDQLRTNLSTRQLLGAEVHKADMIAAVYKKNLNDIWSDFHSGSVSI